MEIILAESNGGKTIELIKRSTETGAVIVCTTVAAKEHILKLAHRMGYKILDPITYSLLIAPGYNRGEHKNGLLIDDLDCMISDIFGGNKILSATVREDMRPYKGKIFFRSIK